MRQRAVMVLAASLAVLCLGPADASDQPSVQEARKGQRGQQQARRSPCPSYFLIGAMKCGTTSLNRHIMEHLPDLYQHKKEVYAFSTKPAKPEYYGAKVFSILDSTPKYLHVRRTPLQIKSICIFRKHPKFVVTLCDPVQRAWSHFRHNIKYRHRERPKGSLAAAFGRMAMPAVATLLQCRQQQKARWSAEGNATGSKEELCGPRPGFPTEIAYSLYGEQLRQWTRLFPRSSFLVVEQSDWAANPDAMVSSVASHFGLRRIAGRKVTAAHHVDHGSIGNEERLSPRVVQVLGAVFQQQEDWKKYVTRLRLPPGGL